ncbi:hypothetical protein [Dinghuibacter silviterrae]|uniref:Outer membrane protein with beta-barrel domain n=1 Tax=Dinghuibacter silviterrae TaxID=1539049 RepID=A0A4R8DPG7_9BACT|nr:hypothetical protein [Dinghuibacter silviterrae]TDW99186.1 hypothetical protein EDB95_0195 [Dinghuibacter silviterrae]
MRTGSALLLIYLVLLCHTPALASLAGDSIRQVSVPVGYLDQVDSKAQRLNTTLSKKTTQYLNRMERFEAKLLGKLRTVDPSVDTRLPAGQYQQLEANMQQPVTRAASTYVPGLDTLSTTLRFLQTQPGGLSPGALAQTGASVGQLQSRLDESTLIQQYITQRKQELAQLISQYTQLPPGVTQAFANFKQTAYYYRQQVEQYKTMLDEPTKMEREVVTLLSRVPAYQAFLAKNSLLAALFRFPAWDGGSLQGLQTQNQVQQLLQQQVGGNGQAVQGQLQAAQSQVASMQNGLSKYGAGGQDLDMPNFKPNTQKTKTFLQRLEYGANIQFGRSSYDFPATGDLGLSLGYKLSDNGSLGVGLSYNVGLGTGWSNIAFSNQGLGLRGYIDWKLWKTWYVTGGYELNYMTAFSGIADLRDRSAWQPSALLGIEKKYRVSSKVQGNVQLLFDALYAQEIPQGQMIRFRVGYNF